MFKIAVCVFLVWMLASCKSKEELKSDQYFAEGYQLYTMNCANCHQPDGKGMSGLYPPISGSSLADKMKLSCIIKNGMKDTIMVDGKQFNRPMPANPKLKDIEIAEIISYMSTKWRKDSTYTTIEFVERSLNTCDTIKAR